MSKTWIVTLTIVITAVVAVGASYYYLNNKAEEEKTELQDQIDGFEDDINQLERQVSSLQTTDSDSASTATTTDETADWETYTNEEYGFSFKYPADWLVRNLTETNSQIEGLSLFIGTNPKAYTGDIFFGVEVINKDLSEVLIELSISSNQTKELSEVEKYGEITTVAITTNKTTGHTHNSYYVEKSGKTFMIFGEDTNPDETTEIGDQIFETFKFTE